MDPQTQLNALLASGVPYSVARVILTSPSMGEGESAPFGWPYAYRGQEQEERAQPDPSDFANWEIEQQQKTHPVRRGYQQSNYQPGGTGMPWDPTSGAAPGQMGQIDPQMLKRWQTVMSLLGGPRGAGGMVNPFGGGMQFGQGAPGGGFANQLANPGQQGGLMAALVQNPDLLQWLMQQQQGGQPGMFPRSGGGVTLAQLLGAPQQQMGQPT